MARSGSPTDDDRQGGQSADEPGGGVGAWVAASSLRIGLAIFGLVLVLIAVSMATGVDVLGQVAEFLSTTVGRWMLVAIVGLVIIAIAVYGFGHREA